MTKENPIASDIEELSLLNNLIMSNPIMMFLGTTSDDHQARSLPPPRSESSILPREQNALTTIMEQSMRTTCRPSTLTRRNKLEEKWNVHLSSQMSDDDDAEFVCATSAKSYHNRQEYLENILNTIDEVLLICENAAKDEDHGRDGAMMMILSTVDDEDDNGRTTTTIKEMKNHPSLS